MGIKKLTVVSILLLGLSACASQGLIKESNEEILFKNFVMSICLGTSFTDTIVASDANKAANGYMEFGNMPIEAYEESRSTVDTWLSKDYSSKAGGQIEIMKCIDLYRSAELKKLYNKYSPCSTKHGWLDISDYHRQCE